jgi:prepilin-type processing-associated H-X9-DG protein
MVHPGLLVVTPKQTVVWSEELHSGVRKGNVLFADDHVEFTKRLPAPDPQKGAATNRLAVP